MTQDLIRRAMALVGRVPDPASVARSVMDARAKGGGVKRKRLLQDQYPTSYMPNVGRQVMADGGVQSLAEALQHQEAGALPGDRRQGPLGAVAEGVNACYFAMGRCAPPRADRETSRN